MIKLLLILEVFCSDKLSTVLCVEHSGTYCGYNDEDELKKDSKSTGKRIISYDV